MSLPKPSKLTWQLKVTIKSWDPLPQTEVSKLVKDEDFFEALQGIFEGDFKLSNEDDFYVHIEGRTRCDSPREWIAERFTRLVRLYPFCNMTVGVHKPDLDEDPTDMNTPQTLEYAGFNNRAGEWKVLYAR